MCEGVLRPLMGDQWVHADGRYRAYRTRGRSSRQPRRCGHSRRYRRTKVAEYGDGLGPEDEIKWESPWCSRTTPWDRGVSLPNAASASPGGAPATKRRDSLVATVAAGSG